MAEGHYVNGEPAVAYVKICLEISGDSGQTKVNTRASPLKLLTGESFGCNGHSCTVTHYVDAPTFGYYEATVLKAIAECLGQGDTVTVHHPGGDQPVQALHGADEQSATPVTDAATPVD